jgi:uncharacterized protein YqhQ
MKKDKKDFEELAARYSAINAYLVLVVAFIGLKNAFAPDILDFLPIFLAILLLVLNNSIKYYNAVPSFLALLISIGLLSFLSYKTYLQPFDEPLEWGRFFIMAISGLPAVYLIIRLVVERSGRS